MLVAISEMPTGWSVDSAPGLGIGCVRAALEPSHMNQTASATATFADIASLPQVSEELATY
jgi:hypothetical protein